MEEATLKSLRQRRKMPLPDLPVSYGHGLPFVKDAHDVYLFPAILRRGQRAAENRAADESGLEGATGSTCYYHPEEEAVSVCDVSGVLICKLCEAKWQGRTVSFDALHKLIANDPEVAQWLSRVKHDDIALSLAILPVLIWPLTLATAPVSLFITLRYWRRGPTSILRRSRWRYGAAGLIASAQIAGWATVFIFTI